MRANASEAADKRKPDGKFLLSSRAGQSYVRNVRRRVVALLHQAFRRGPGHHARKGLWLGAVHRWLFPRACKTPALELFSPRNIAVAPSCSPKLHRVRPSSGYRTPHPGEIACAHFWTAPQRFRPTVNVAENENELSNSRIMALDRRRLVPTWLPPQHSTRAT
jgi:hypothetical protein